MGTSGITGAVAQYTGGANASYVSTPLATPEVLLNPNPVHGDGTTGGGICTYGLFCAAVPGSNRDLGDVFEVHLDPAGGANVTWTSDNGGGHIEFACQNSGPSAIAGAPDLNGCYGPADMSVANTDSPDPVAPGGTITYHITATNDGTVSMPATTSGVTVTDTLPSSVTFVSATPSRGTCSGTITVTCDFGILPSGASASVDIVGSVSAGATGTISNTASVSAATADPDTSNNSATTTTTVATPTTADVAVSIGDNPDPARVNQNLTYTVTVTNLGPANAAQVSLDDVLGKNSKFVSASSTKGTCTFVQKTGIVRCSLGSIASGQAATVTIVVKPTKDGTLTDSAKATSSTADPQPANNSDSEATTVRR